MRENTRSLSNVEIVAAAAGTTSGTVKLFRHPEFSSNPDANSHSSSIIADKENISKDEYFDLPPVDVVELILGLDQQVGVLKVDIEGAEVELFETMFNRQDVMSRIHYIFAQTHEDRIPGHKPRVEQLKSLAQKMPKPKIDLNWY